jgi:hypothetical protein
MGLCIADIFPSITNKMQRYTIYLLLYNSLHVSGGTSAHNQELKTVYDGRRYRLTHVEHFTEINKLCNVASFWLYLEIKLQACI